MVGRQPGESFETLAKVLIFGEALSARPRCRTFGEPTVPRNISLTRLVRVHFPLRFTDVLIARRDCVDRWECFASSFSRTTRTRKTLEHLFPLQRPLPVRPRDEGNQTSAGQRGDP